MLNLKLIQQLLIIAIVLSVITCAFIQKTKGMFKSSKWINLYSFIVNILFGVAFCFTFTDVLWFQSLWVGGFAFIGADTLYKSLEGKIKSYSDLIPKEEVIEISRGDE